MRLRNDAAREALAPIVVMALRAREIELALPAIERRAPGFEDGRRGFVPFDGDRHAARLAPHVGGEREPLAALVGQGRSLLPPRAATVDLLLEVHRPPGLDLRIARGDAFHVAVAGGAGDPGLPFLAAPERFAVEQPEHRGAGSLVVLHGPRFAAHELVARAALGERNLARSQRRRKDRQKERKKPQTTVIDADCVATYPLSPVHLSSNVPLSMATVVKVSSGFAAIAGCSSARNTSTPL